MITSKILFLIFFFTFVSLSFTQSQKTLNAYKSSLPIEEYSNLESFIKYRNVNSPNEITWNEGLTACVRFKFKKLQGIVLALKSGNLF